MTGRRANKMLQIMAPPQQIARWRDAWAGDCYLSGRWNGCMAAWARDALDLAALEVEVFARHMRELQAQHPDVAYQHAVKLISGMRAAKSELHIGLLRMPSGLFAEVAHNEASEPDRHLVGYRFTRKE